MPDVPSISREEPVLMSIEEDVLGSARSVVDRGSGDDPERRRARELNPDVDTDLSIHGFRYCQREQRREHESFHGLPTFPARTNLLLFIGRVLSALGTRSLGCGAVGRRKIGALLEHVVDGVTAQDARQLIGISDGTMLGAIPHDDLCLGGAESGKL
jgi:hypothetical protein